MTRKPSRVVVRWAASADLPALGRLGTHLVEFHHQLDRQRFMPSTESTEAGYAAFLESQLARPEVILLVADDAGDVVGYAYAGLEGNDYMALREPAGVLYDLIVDPARRGEGIGRSLLQVSLDTLKSRGAPRVVLSTAARNEAAQRIFASAGFRPTMIEMTRELE